MIIQQEIGHSFIVLFITVWDAVVLQSRAKLLMTAPMLVYWSVLWVVIYYEYCGFEEYVVHTPKVLGLGDVPSSLKTLALNGMGNMILLVMYETYNMITTGFKDERRRKATCFYMRPFLIMEDPTCNISEMARRHSARQST